MLGGNRSGKTVSGAAETVYRLLGDHPYKRVHRPPIKAWIVSQDLPGKLKPKPDNEQGTHKQLEELRRWIPRDALKGGSWETAFSAGELSLTLANGGLAVFKGYDQGLLKFESDAIHWCWMDEEPDDKRLWSSILLRLADYDGQWMMTATPVLSLQGKGWIEELWDNYQRLTRAEQAKHGYEVHHLYSENNPYVRRDVFADLFSNLTEDERQVRAYGLFARMGGRVLSEYDPSVHKIHNEFVPPRTWRHYLIIDPGWTIGAHLWAAVDPLGTCWLYAEHYQGKTKPHEHVRVLHGMWGALGRPEITCIMDPAGFSIHRTTTGHESPSDADEYMKAAEELGADWLVLSPADNSDPLAWRVKRYLACERLKIMASLEKWFWEQERWVRQRELDGPRATERPVPERPVDRNDHLMSCTRYLCNLLPDPMPVREEEPFPGSAQEHWMRRMQALDSRNPDYNEGML